MSILNTTITGDGWRPKRAEASHARSRVGIRRATMEEWQAAFRSDPLATFFHGPAWSEVWHEQTRGRFRPHPIHVEFSDGHTAVIGTTVERTRSRLALHHLSPAGTYGGWVSRHALSRAQEHAITDVVVGLGSVVWRMPPSAHHLHDVERHDAGDDGTFLVPLEDGVEAALGRWAEKARGRVNRARRKGIVVRRGGSDDDWAQYLDLYLRQVARWGEATSSLYGEELFVALRRHGAGDVRMFVAEHEGRMVAAAVVLTAGRYASGWHQVARRDGPPGAVNMLHWRITELLADAGFNVYDLNPSGGHQGSAEFKKRIGGVPAPAPIVIRWSGRARMLRCVTRGLRGRT